MAIAFAGTLFMTANARTSSARPSDKALSVLQLNYFVGAGGHLASTLDPGLVSAANAADTIAMIQANLVYVGTDNKVHLDLAQRYIVSKNRKVYTFTIRPNARYSNGHYVTASDIKESIQEAAAPSTASPVAAEYMGAIVGVNDFNAGKRRDIPGIRVLSRRTIQFTLTKPYAYFLKTLSYSTSDALDQQVMKGTTRSALNNTLTTDCTKNQGAGPFTFVCYGKNFYPPGRTPSYTLVPNPYYRRKLHIEVDMPAIGTFDTGYRVYLAGQIDTTGIPSGLVHNWRGNTQLRTFATSIVSFITPNVRLAPFNDRHCRLAVAYGIDRNALARSILHGLPRVIYDVVPPGFLGYYNGNDNPHYNLRRARAEFTKCGPRSTPVTFRFATGSADLDNTAIVIVDNLRRVGFDARGKALVVNESIDRLHTQLFLSGWQQDYPDPQDYVSLLLHCGNLQNIGGYCSKTFDKLVDRADIEPNPKKRAELYIKAQHLAIGLDAAWITLTNDVGYALVKPYVHGLTGTVAYAHLVPVDYDWSRVSLSKH